MASGGHGVRRLGGVPSRLRLHQPVAVHVPAAQRAGGVQRAARPRRRTGGPPAPGHDVGGGDVVGRRRDDVRDDVRRRPAAHHRHADLRRHRLHRLPGRLHEHRPAWVITSVSAYRRYRRSRHGKSLTRP